jgi:hypothetical protein
VELLQPPAPAQTLAQSLAVWGLVIEQDEAEGSPDEPVGFEAWPDTLQAIAVLDRMATQWAVGSSGRPIGLRYESLSQVMTWCGIPADEHAFVWADVQTMELAQLDHWDKQAKHRQH